MSSPITPVAPALTVVDRRREALSIQALVAPPPRPQALVAPPPGPQTPVAPPPRPRLLTDLLGEGWDVADDDEVDIIRGVIYDLTAAPVLKGG